MNGLVNHCIRKAKNLP